jgi:hypothetical protein
MKYKALSLAAILCSMLLLSIFYCGCTTTSVVVDGQTNQVQVLRPEAAAAISGILAIATPIAVKEDPNAGPYLAMVANVFSMSAEVGVYDPVLVQRSLDAISIRELRDSTTAKQVVVTAMAAYKGIFAEAVNAKLDAAKWGPFAKSLLSAMANGITAGLAAGSE